MPRALALVLLLVALGGGAYLFLRPSGGPASGPTDEGGGDPKAPGAVDGPGGAPTAADGAAARGVLAAAGRRPERAGRGGVTLKVARARGGTPAEGARVVVTGTGHAGEVVDLAATADARGVVKLSGVAAGAGLLLRVDAGQDGRATRPDVEVRAGRVTDLGTVLVGAGVVLTGRVVDEQGAGIAGADVRALVGFENPMDMLANLFEMFTSMGREPTPLAKTTSGPDGAFRLEDVPPGAVVVRGASPGRRLATVAVKALADPAPAPVTLRLERGADTGGVVVGERGVPVEGATVAMMRTDGGDEMMDWMSRRVFATTGPGGRFDAVLEAGTKGWRAIVEADGYPTTVSAAFSAGARDVRIPLARGAELEVTLLQEGDDAPVAGATIALGVGALDGAEGTEESGAFPSAVTDAAGVARIPARPGKVQMLLVMVPGRDFLMAAPGRMGAGQSGGLAGEVPAEVVADRPTRVTLRIKTAVLVTGTVKARDGQPLEGVEVRSLSFFGGAGGSPFRTDASGTYRVPVTSVFGGGGAMLTFQAPGFVRETANVTIDDEVRKAGTVTHDVTLKRAATLRGRVVAPDGTPVAGAKVTLEGGDPFGGMLGGPAAATTGADGAYVLDGVGPSGEEGSPFAPKRPGGPGEDAKTVLAVEAEGFVEARTEPVAVKEGAQVTVPTVKLSRGAVVSGVVRGPDGRPAAGATVELTLEPKDGTTPRVRFGGPTGVRFGHTRKLSADAEGRFEARAVEVGTATLTAHAAGAASTRRTVEVAGDGADVDGSLQLRPAVRLVGVVLDDRGSPVKGARVAVSGGLHGLSDDASYVASEGTLTKADGRFELADLPPGTVTLSVHADGFRSAVLPMATSGPAEVRLAPRSAADRRRLEEVQKEVLEVSQRFAAAKDDKERQALQQELMRLVQEQQALSGTPVEETVPMPEEEPVESVPAPAK